jgi:short-subunit dehydrogenase
MTYWRGKRAVITGGSAGLGRALAGILVERGARVAIVARGQQALDATAAELRADGGDVLVIAADVTNADSVQQMADAVQRGLGGVDLLCHCAGRSMRGNALTTSAAEYRDLWETNFLSAVRCVQALTAPVTASRGHIVLVGSLASKVAPRYLGAYPASKFPLAALAQQLRLELAGQGVHVLLVCPGPIAREGEAPARRSSPKSAEPGGRYSDRATNIPATAHKPGGGVKVAAVAPQWLAEKILRACERRQAELIVPGRARLLFAISQLSPRLGDWLLRRMTAG